MLRVRHALLFQALFLLLSAPAPATEIACRGAVCERGGTRPLRASPAELRRVKRELLSELGLGPEHACLYQLDHRLPLVLGGGSGRDNLVLQEIGAARRKDQLERRLGCLVCAGALDLDDARAAILDDWQAAWWRFMPLRCSWRAIRRQR